MKMMDGGIAMRKLRSLESERGSYVLIQLSGSYSTEPVGCNLLRAVSDSLMASDGSLQTRFSSLGFTPLLQSDPKHGPVQ